ncbi:unnamed protein product [Linum tenue]|uniref:Glycosyltransferase n=1 Tax=Linum tenue TaxID=586396 RepID=A0AAV0JLY5_9ROSI|nr:unnamed protein product [Linum tenue]
MSPTSKQGLENVDGGHIVICPFPFTCHPTALFNLTIKLATSSPQTDFSFLTTHTNKLSLLYPRNNNAPPPTNLKLHTISDGLPDHNNSAKEAADNHKNFYHMDRFNEAMPGNFKQGIDAATKASNKKKKKISYIIADALCAVGVAPMAKEMEVPWAALWVNAPFALHPFSQMDHIYQLSLQLLSPDDDHNQIIPGFSPLRFNDLPENSLQPTGMPYLGPIMRALPEASAIVLNASREICCTPLSSSISFFLDGPDHKPQLGKLFFAGCLTLPSVLTTTPSSSSSLVNSDDDDGTIFPEGLMEKLPRGFVERTREYGKVVPWVRQVEVLRHGAIGVQVTHCGYNSVLESIFGGVPLICRPVWADNHIVARWVEEVWDIGVGVEGGIFTKDGVCRCLAVVLGEEKGREMRANVGALREKMLAAAGPNGSAGKDLEALLEMMMMHAG